MKGWFRCYSKRGIGRCFWVLKMYVCLCLKGY